MKYPRVLVAFNAPDNSFLKLSPRALFKGDDWQTERDVCAALKKLRHPFQVAGVFDSLAEIKNKIKLFKPDVIFNLVEKFKNDAALEVWVTAQIEKLGVPVTGCRSSIMRIAKDKQRAKQIMARSGVLVPRGMVIRHRQKIKLPHDLPFPWIVKPLQEEASVGVSLASLVHSPRQFKARVRALRSMLGGDVLVEEYVFGREIYSAVLEEKKVFPPREITFGRAAKESRKIATYEAKWNECYRKKWGIRNQFAKNLTQAMVSQITKLSKKIACALSVNGPLRLDLRLTPEGKIYFIEANPNPMLAKGEDYALSAQKVGLSYPRLVHRLIHLALAAEV